MSYQIGTASSPRFSRVRPLAGRTLVRPPMRGRKVRRRRGPNLPGQFQRFNNYGRMSPGLSGGTRYLGDLDDTGLGKFSLKRMFTPPKSVRKIAKVIKKNVTLKRALIGGAIVGAAFIPGVGPAALAAAKAAGRVGFKALRGTGKFIGHEISAAEQGIVGLFKRKPQDSGPGGDTGSDTGDSGNVPGAPSPPASTGGGSPSGGAYGPPAPDASSGGGGGFGPGAGDDSGGDFSTAPLPDDSTELTATAQPEDGAGAPSNASAVPIVIGVATLALLSMAGRGRRRRRAA